MGMTPQHDTHHLFARFTEADGVDKEFIYWVEFRPVGHRGICRITFCHPQAPFWERVPVAGTIMRHMNKSGRHEWTVSVETGRVIWKMLIRNGWYATVHDAQVGKPVWLLSVEDLLKIVEGQKGQTA